MVHTMTEELEQLLKNLKLRRVLEIYDEQLRAAEKEDVTYSELVTRLVRAQWHARQEGALEWRIRRANLPERLSARPSPVARRVGIHVITFEACSGFTRVTAYKVAHPPFVGFIAKLRPNRFPGSDARKLSSPTNNYLSGSFPHW